MVSVPKNAVARQRNQANMLDNKIRKTLTFNIFPAKLTN